MGKQQKNRLIEIIIVAILIIISFLYFKPDEAFDAGFFNYGFIISVIAIIGLYKLYLWIKG